MHFNIVDNVLRMVVAIIRFKVVLAMQKSGEWDDFLSKEEMEMLLDSSNSLPSQATIPFNNGNLKDQQFGAVCALHEFLRLSESLM